MKQKKRNFEIFSLSFLDVISCGFGAIVLLVLISKQLPEPAEQDTNQAVEILGQVLQAESAVENLTAQLQQARQDIQSKQVLLSTLQAQSTKTRASLSAVEQESAGREKALSGLAEEQATLKQTSISASTAKVRDEEVGGIPVDSDYVVFIVDTSGSMQEIWARVVREIENVLAIHPQIKGFQILNDNGVPLVPAYEGKWIPDTPRRRKNVIDLFRSWSSVSNSSPVEGLEVALKRYAKPGRSVSVYIFGDEYSGSSYDPVINALVKLNTNRITGEKLARVHAVGFISPYSTGRFATLMREVTRRNRGTFLALPR